MAIWSGDSGLFRYVTECAAAIVAIENVAVERQPPGSAIDGEASIKTIGARSRFRRCCGIELQVVGNEQIEFSIPVNIDKCTTGVVAYAILGEMRCGCDILEALTFDVAVEPGCAPVGDRQVGESVIIKISGAYTLRPPLGG